MRKVGAGGVVITLLNVVIVALVAVLVFFPELFGRSGAEGEEPVDEPVITPPADDGEEPAHQKLRAASAGLVSGIVRETRLMGLGDETVVKAFFRDGGVYIFGNTPVRGLDFDSYGGFVCTIDADGRISAYEYFDGNVKCVCAFGSGFVLVAGNALYRIGGSGAVDRAMAVEEEAVDIFPLDGSAVGIVTAPTPNSLRFCEYIISGGEWSKGRSTRIDSGYYLGYFDTYIFGGTYVIAAREYSLPRFDSLALFVFMPGGSSSDHRYGGLGDALIRPFDILPSDGGYTVLAQKGGVAAIIDIDHTFTAYGIRSLGFSCDGARYIYAGGRYFAVFDRGGDSVTYEVTADGKSPVELLNGFTPMTAVKGDSLTFLCVSGQKEIAGESVKKYLSVVCENGRTLSLDITGGQVYAAAAKGSELLVLLSARGGEAVSAPCAGSDIYLIAVDRAAVK